MNKRIETLTPEQTALLPVQAEKWTRIGLSCEPLNRASAEDAVRRVYAIAKLPAPKLFVVCDSPLSAAITAAILKSLHASVWASVRASVRDSVWASVRDSVWASVGASVWASVGASVWDSVGASVWASVGDSVWASVGASVWASVWASVRDSVWASVWASVGDSVGDSVWASVGASVRDSVRDSVGASVRASVRDSVYGSHDANWLGFYEYFSTSCGLADQVAPLQPLIDLAQHCGWWMPYANVCILQHRHCELHWDANGRLHNANGPAILYRDGWGVYLWHGLRIPMDKQWIIDEPDRITVSAIDDERNAEIRRVMIELFGRDRYIVESGLQPVHSDSFGDLFRRELAGDEPLQLVKVVNSTPEPDGSRKTYWLRVPPTLKTAREAVAWTFGMKKSEYAPVVES